MRHEITMPQLGMTQDSGVIVSWGKKPGDTVKADDILMEVETDKSTMEVEVGHDGFLAEIRAESGAAVPVGDVVAVISDSADDVVTERVQPQAESESGSKEARSPETATQEGASNPRAAPASPPQTGRSYASAQATGPKPAAAARPNGGGRVLASPKARMEAHRRGIDLARLARQGLAQPVHVADLETLAARPKTGGGALSALAAAVDGSAFEEFCEWAETASDGAASSAAIWSAFASASWRAGLGLGAGEPVTVRFETLVPIPAASTFQDADGAGLGDIAPLDKPAEADIVVLDLTGSGLTEYRSGGSAVATVTVARDGEALRIAFGFDEADLPVAKAAAVLAGLAGRVGQPLRHLL